MLKNKSLQSGYYPSKRLDEDDQHLTDKMRRRERHRGNPEKAKGKAPTPRCNNG